MPRIRLTLTGDKEATVKFRRMPTRIQRGLIPAVRIGARALAADARRRVTSRRVARALKVRQTDVSRNRTAFEVNTGSREELGITTGFYFPAAIEYGTERQAAQPFLRPAADAGGPKLESEAARSIRRTVAQQAV